MARKAVAVILMGLAGLMCVAERGKLAFVATALAADHGCSLASLRGTYGLYGQGTAFIGTPQVGQEVDIGIFNADGKGNAVGSVIFSLNGKIFRTKFTGSYLVNADCTATVTIQDDLGEVLHEEGVIFDGGRVFRFIETDPGQLVARVAERLNE
jgi:hypothetical protein